MTEATALTTAAISHEPDWQAALDEVLEKTGRDAAGAPDLVLLFASAEHRKNYAELVAQAYERTGARLLAGCSGQGIIGLNREVEGEPALALLSLSLPKIELQGVWLSPETIENAAVGTVFSESLDVPPSGLKGWLVLADPFTTDVDRMIETLGATYPEQPIIGGLASGAHAEQHTFLFLNGEVYDRGAVGVAVRGMVTMRTVVSQGATPIGEPWTITASHANVIDAIGGRPAYEVLIQTIESLPESAQSRAAANLLVGLAVDEYQDSFRRGDFLIRNLLGVDRRDGGLVVGSLPRVGQTVQFQMRDAAAADEELGVLLRAEHEALGNRRPAAAMLCACNGRGVGLFGVHDHDAGQIAAEFGPLPLVGFFCNGEIGPVGGKTFLHGFTASIALIVPGDDSTRAQQTSE